MVANPVSLNCAFKTAAEVFLRRPGAKYSTASNRAVPTITKKAVAWDWLFARRSSLPTAGQQYPPALQQQPPVDQFNEQSASGNYPTQETQESVAAAYRERYSQSAFASLRKQSPSAPRNNPFNKDTKGSVGSEQTASNEQDQQQQSVNRQGQDQPND